MKNRLNYITGVMLEVIQGRTGWCDERVARQKVTHGWMKPGES